MNLSPNGLALQEAGMLSMTELDQIKGRTWGYGDMGMGWVGSYPLVMTISVCELEAMAQSK